MAITEEWYAKDRKALRAWLQKNHARSSGIWLIYDTGTKRTLKNRDITAECICFGWIDSKVGKVDASRTKLYISPRSPKSNWSRFNKAIVKELEKAKLLHESGKAMIRIAQERGTWNALDEVENLTIPPDLRNALQKKKHAEAHFEAFPRSVKRGILEWIMNAKRAETRLKRIKETATLAEKNIRANQYRP